MNDRKIRVLIGANDLVLAGVQRLVIEQLERLDRTQYEVSLIVLRQFPGKETFDHAIPKDVRVHRLNFKSLYDVGEWRKLIRILKAERPRVVKTATFFSNTLFLLLGPFFGYRVIAAEHNTVAQKPFFQRALNRILLSRAYAIVADSKGVADFISESEGVSRAKLRVIYNGADLEAIARAEAKYRSERAALRKTHGISEDAFVFFTAARLVKQKNHELMVEAFTRVHKKHSHARLMIAGDGALRAAIEERARTLGVERDVVMLGEQHDIYRFYAASDVFLLTSRHEGFCIAAMEGLAFGMPLISTRVAGVSEYLSDGVNGYFAEHEAEDIAQKMIRVMEQSPEERTRMREAGKATASQFSLERYGAEINELVLEAAS